MHPCSSGLAVHMLKAGHMLGCLYIAAPGHVACACSLKAALVYAAHGLDASPRLRRWRSACGRPARRWRL